MQAPHRLLNKKLILILLPLLCLLLLSTLLYTGIVWPNNWFVSQYPIRGLDVSNHQQLIDWKSVAQTGKYSFVFVKATEGSDYQDTYFRTNWRATQANGLLHGAYHFYIADISGAEQANNFISMVPKEAGMLPPVLDLEVTGPDRSVMLREIRVFLNQLQQHYGMKPIIYTDLDRYAAYVKGNFEDYPLWLGEALFPVQWSSVKNWTIWQYNDRGHVPGIANVVDLNVFYGDRDQLNALTMPSIS